MNFTLANQNCTARNGETMNESVDFVHGRSRPEYNEEEPSKWSMYIKNPQSVCSVNFSRWVCNFSLIILTFPPNGVKVKKRRIFINNSDLCVTTWQTLIYREKGKKHKVAQNIIKCCLKWLVYIHFSIIDHVTWERTFNCIVH